MGASVAAARLRKRNEPESVEPVSVSRDEATPEGRTTLPPIGTAPLRRFADPLGGSAVDADVQSVLRRREGGGQPLPAGLSGQFGQILGQDFSGVRVHADSEAGGVARALQSHAFTHGNDLYFAPGKFQPGSTAGQQLIAHELGHVVAQRTGADRGDGGGLTVGAADHPAEAAADRVAEQAMGALRRKASQDSRPDAHGSGCGCGTSAQARDTTAIRRNPSGNAPVKEEPPSALKDQVPENVSSNTIEEGRGKFSGTKVDKAEGKTSKKSVAGVWKETEDKSDVNTGKVHQKTTVKTNGMAGAEAYLETIAKSTPDQLKLAFTALARAGAFGGASAETEVTRGKFKAGGSAEISGGAGVSTGSSGSMTIDTSRGGLPELELALSAFVKAGVEFNASASGFAGIGPLQVLGKIEAAGFAGARAYAEGKLKLGLVGGLEASGKAGAIAGAEASGGASVTVKLSDMEVKAALAGEAFAGAKGTVEGKFKISLSEVEISGKAEAFAGASAEASGSAEWSYKGRSIIKAEGKVSVDAGVGGKAEGKFAYKNGKLTVSFGGKAALGIGAGVKIEGSVDFLALGEAVYSEVANLVNRNTVKIGDAAGEIDRQPVVDQLKAVQLRAAGYEAYIADFRAYAAKKLSGGENGIKKERVEELLKFRRGQLGMDLVFVETDEGIEKAANEAFKPFLKPGGSPVRIQGGKLKEFDVITDIKDVTKVRGDVKQDAAVTAFQSELTSWVSKSRAKNGNNSVDQTALDALVAKHYPKISAGGSNDADTVITKLVNDALGGVITGYGLAKGVPTKYTVDTAKVDELDKSDKLAAANAEIRSLLGEIRSACAAYAAKKSMSGDSGVKEAKVKELIAGPVAKVKKAVDAKHSADIDAAIVRMLTEGLGAAAKDIEVKDGEITKITTTPGAELKKLTKDKIDKDAAAAARTKACEKAKTKFGDYVAELTVDEEEAFDLGTVQKIVSDALKVAGKDAAAKAEMEAALTESAREAFAALITKPESLWITDGVLRVHVRTRKLKDARDKVTADSERVGKYFGEEQGNQRRYNVRNALLDRLKRYFVAVRSTPDRKVSKSDIQALITERTSGFSSELSFDDAKAELSRTVIEASAGILTEWTVDASGKVTGMKVDQSALDKMREEDRTGLQAALVGKLTGYTGDTSILPWKSKPTITASGLQTKVDAAISEWGKTTTAAGYEAAITAAVAQVFPKLTVTVKGRKVSDVKQ